MRRRRALQLVGGTVCALAGCLGQNGSDSEPTPDQDPGKTTTPRAEPTPRELGTQAGDGVAVDAVSVQRSVIHHHAWREIHEPDDGQMLVVTGSVPASIDRSAVRFDARLDGDTVSSTVQTELRDRSRLYALSVPVETVDEAELVLQNGAKPAWRLPDDVTETLAAAPEFRLTTAEILDTDGDTGLRLTVENRGERDSVFRGVVEYADAADADSPVEIQVSAGETVTETVQPSALESWSADAEFARDIAPKTRVFEI
jgi:hypothetical protein